MEILYSNKVIADYENFVAFCPYCEYKNVYNRVSDIKRVNPIDFEEVVCFNDECKRVFYVNGDSVTTKSRYLVFNCERLKEHKQYMFCILNLAQAYESMFWRFLRIKFIDLPLKQKRFITNKELNTITDLFESTFGRLSFNDLRDIFIRLAYKNKEYFTVTEIEDEFSGIREFTMINRLFQSKTLLKNLSKSHIKAIEELSKTVKDWGPLKNRDIKSIEQKKLGDLLFQLKQCLINLIRNRVVHSEVYRPSRKEVDDYLSEARHIIFQLENTLNIDFIAFPRLADKEPIYFT